MYDTTDSAPLSETIDEEALRKRLVNRIAIAGVAIVLLLGVLAGIDALYVPSPTAPPKASAPPLSTEAAKPVEVMSLSATAVAMPEPPQPEAIPTIKSQVEPEESASPSTSVRNEMRPAAKIAAARAETKQQPVPAPHSAVPRPLTQPKTETPTDSRFVLQMGVFKNVSNAQELLAKLQQSGIPAQIEARVQVGPFKTKAEADEARTKLRALGLDAGLLVPAHR